MPMRYHAQRRHVIHSLDALMYQLHTLSFFLSPTVWIYVCRCATQITFSRPRDIDNKRSLRRWFFLVLLFNAGSVWVHATNNEPGGTAVVLDFVGLAYTPSKTRLLVLDFVIIFLELVLTTIAYETSVSAAMPADALDGDLLGVPKPEPLASDTEDDDKSVTLAASAYVLDLRLQPTLARLRSAAPPTAVSATGQELPLPNTTPFQVPGGLRMLLRARARARARMQQQGQGQADGPRAPSRSLPGSMDAGNGG